MPVMGRRLTEGNVLYSFYQLAKVVWDWCIGLSTGVISQDPQHFSPATWKFVTETLYPGQWESDYP